MHQAVDICGVCARALAAVTTTPDAPAAAKERLKQRGALSKGELITLASLGVAVTMWVGGEHLKVRTAAMERVAGDEGRGHAVRWAARIRR